MQPKIKCPSCKNMIYEQIKYCPKCGYVFTNLLNLNINLNEIGNRRSLENVDMD